MEKPEAEFKEFERRLKYGWFQLNIHKIVSNVSRFKPSFGGFKSRLKFFKFGVRTAREGRKFKILFTIQFKSHFIGRKLTRREKERKRVD